MGSPLSNPKAVVEKGEEIYDQKYRAEFEKLHHGKFVLIEVKSGEAFLGDSPEDVYKDAAEKTTGGVFHLIRVGSPGAFRVSYSSSHHADADWF